VKTGSNGLLILVLHPLSADLKAAVRVFSSGFLGYELVEFLSGSLLIPALRGL